MLIVDGEPRFFWALLLRLSFLAQPYRSVERTSVEFTSLTESHFVKPARAFHHGQDNFHPCRPGVGQDYLVENEAYAIPLSFPMGCYADVGH